VLIRGYAFMPLLGLPYVSNSSASAGSSFREIPCYSVANSSACFVLLSVVNLHNKTNYALYLNNNLGFIIKNHHGWIR